MHIRDTVCGVEATVVLDSCQRLFFKGLVVVVHVDALHPGIPFVAGVFHEGRIHSASNGVVEYWKGFVVVICGVAHGHLMELLVQNVLDE